MWECGMLGKGRDGGRGTRLKGEDRKDFQSKNSLDDMRAFK